MIDGLTGDQRFFLGWAQVWREKIRDEALRQQLVTDPHSPARLPGQRHVRNIDAWYDAFDVKPGDKLYVAPADRVRHLVAGGAPARRHRKWRRAPIVGGDIKRKSAIPDIGA